MRIDVVKKRVLKLGKTMNCCGCTLNGMEQRGIKMYRRREKSFRNFNS